MEGMAEKIFITLNGEYLPGMGVEGVENAFAEGRPCMKRYAEAYDAYQRLCDRLGVVDEDEDVEIIFSAFLDIIKIMGMEMFRYGKLFGEGKLQKT